MRRSYPATLQYVENQRKDIMKILSLNAGYFLGYAGTPGDYLLHPWKAVVGSRGETQAINEFVTLVRDVDPDAVVLQEVDTGSIRTRTTGQVQYIAERLPADYDLHVATKYSSTVLSRLPMLRHMSNGLLCKEGTVQEYYLDSGIKSLVQEIQVDGISVFSVHLARFGARIRRHQLQELSDILRDREHPLVVGDFNALTGMEETDLLQERAGLNIACPGNTFPSSHPIYALDFTAYSSNLSVQCRKLDSVISDHAPIVVTVDEQRVVID